ncbi:hypothetical protein R3W88_019164 [Solanum pinnatisectum]|uniref:GPI ethanolamine phosphate transferase 3 n=1 Tax=Solanum pinnatisectum TaxID=50273 RepID=A0AAV9KIS3_9SOLN|nr:hypothetical protein R3W88_019164 [Solanum pinnatisectum]
MSKSGEVSWKSENLGKRRWAFVVFLGILILHGLAILIFTRGFLLTRTELSQYSHCSDIQQSPCFSPPQEDQMVNHSKGCWTKPAVDRIVIIILDALRYDFVAPSTFFDEKKPWMDRLQVLHKLASQPGSFAKIFKAIADPPTTSLQRLKGLTTGGLPTFIDVGNSFGAPAIIEDNLIYQMAKNGKRVVMMGDDTWVQLFPQHFNISHPFPSFNVKDLDTVDNGCVEHLFPYLYQEDWDVLIAHFLGVDHAGHIFGVDSTEMIEKLEQYNGILEKVVDVLESQNRPGGFHENTLLLVMGDHGQTINGDHGGGAPEEVETSLFAMSLQKNPSSLPSETDSSSCRLDTEKRKICTSSIEQLDFAATVSALLGIPYPFGSIGRVNPELYALATGTWNLDIFTPESGISLSGSERWMQNYVNVLCMNTWQVKRYIDVYSASSVIGFSDKDMSHVSDLYAQAHDNWLHTKEAVLNCKSESCSTLLPQLKKQVEAYANFLSSITALARSKWTEFNLKMMGTGLCILVLSLFTHIFTIKKLDKLCSCYLPRGGDFVVSFEAIFAYAAVLIRSFSFLSNSFILEEGKTASFLLATAGMLQLRHAIVKKKMFLEGLLFVLVVPLLRFGIELGQSKQAVNSLFLKSFASWTVSVDNGTNLWIYVADILPFLALVILAYILYYKSITHSSCRGIFKLVAIGTIFASSLIALAWALDGNLFSPSTVIVDIKAYWIPRIIYVIGLLQLILLAISQLFGKEKTSGWEEDTIIKATAMLSAWSSTIIILSGKQGPLVALAAVIQGWCVIRLMTLERAKNDYYDSSTSYSSPVAKCSLLAVCLFFCTGHWCAFDGLRYASAFVGFDEFNLIRQAALLTIDTFGFSHILPVMGLPLIVACRRHPEVQAEKRKPLFFLQLCQVYLMYGLIMAISMTLTIICVTIQRRHLMVWGLFAPKFVFDAVGLLLTDLFICLASLYYFA